MTKYVHNTLEKYTNKDTFNLTYDIEKSHDNYLYDSLNNKELLDCFSFFASNPLGYNHPKLNTPEFEKKLLRVAKTNPSNGDIPTQEYADFINTFKSISDPDNKFNHLFFISGGALAVENALKTAFDWKIRKNLDLDISNICVNDLEILHLEKAFHGRSGYTLSLTNTDPIKIKLFPKFTNWPRFKAPLDCGMYTHMDRYLTSQMALNEIDEYLSKNLNKVAAIIIEPIQGEGGDRHFPVEFHQGLRTIASSYNCLLIYDEIQTGVGLTGKMWAFEHFGMTPDIVCFGKKMQVCGIMCSDRIMEISNNVFVEKSRIDSTWGGNLTDMVRAQRYLEIIHEDNLIENAKIVGNELLSTLKDLSSSFCLMNVRGRGLMCAFDYVSKQRRNELIAACFAEGLIVLPCGEKSIRLRPSLTFTLDNVKEFKFKLKQALRKVG